MIVRGLLVAVSGFLFIFSPGLPMGLLSRRLRAFRREMLIWGIGTWLISLFPALFLQSLLKQFLGIEGSLSGESAGISRVLIPLIGLFVGAFVVQGALYIVLRRKRQDDQNLLMDGLSLGFGSGLVAQAFIGLSFVGAGFRLVFGDTSGPILGNLAEASLIHLMLWLLAHILYRTALPVVTGALGVLLGGAVGGRLRNLWLAIAIYAVYDWAFGSVQVGLGVGTPGQLLAGEFNLIQSLVAVGYYILAFFIAYRWLLKQLPIQRDA